MIISGAIDATDQVDANRLTDALGIGRTPIREALLRLQADGIVEIVPKRGVHIVTLSADDITEIYQIISAVEIEAVRLLTESVPSSSDLQQLVDACESMVLAAGQDDRESWVLADEAFHRSILQLNPNRRLCDVGLQHRDLAQRAHFVALRLLRPKKLEESAERHRELIDLILSGDSAKAVACHRKQRDRGADLLINIVRKYRLARL